MEGQQEQAIVPMEPGSEWRFELEPDENIALRVHSTDPVYINGEELPPTTWYPLYRYNKGAVYSPTEGKIEGEPSCLREADFSVHAAGISVHLDVDDTAAPEQPASGARAATHSVPTRR
ncbi:hypothetical protein A1Q2_03301 [Trichosporon asahii var. asahii CBS 8904]|uniref:Clp1 N-terminal domain-containing protein n=2 Tax=Trichosporon asahii var. asahii TaxID=189963 RepID=K1WMQ4_TRIAC|nr:hypothetical protein A1Q1_06645 [Trichosporon asahii var. asahii CBS 2479]EJT52107.1 hypothetical protein A1Q1_06645 [Trichosporon asahii var. asahii CBS 2479]EKD02409.1 hypothetical protein A1Q2_03301 [Trichosporon asahii var. asahii CBS 8904]